MGNLTDKKGRHDRLKFEKSTVSRNGTPIIFSHMAMPSRSPLTSAETWSIRRRRLRMRILISKVHRAPSVSIESVPQEVGL